MFQYAFGRALALRHGVPLKLDLSEFRTYKLHSGFILDKAFGLISQQANAEDLRKVLGCRGYRTVLRLLRRPRFERWRGTRLLVQDLSVPASEYVAAASADCYLVGYWQSDAYFLNAGEQLRRDFHFPELPRENA